MNVASLLVTLQFAGITLVLLTSLRLWSRAVQRWKVGEPLIPADTYRPAPWGLFDLAAALVLQVAVAGTAFHFAQSQLGLDLSRPSNDVSQEAYRMLLFAGVNCIACLLIVAWLFARYRIDSRDLGIQWDAIRRDCVTGVAAFVMLAPLVYGLQLLLVQFVKSEHPLIELLKANPSPRFFAVSGLVAVVVAPLAEEFIYRLLLQGWLARLARGVDQNAFSLFLGGRIGANANDGHQADIAQEPTLGAPNPLRSLSETDAGAAGTREENTPSAKFPSAPLWPIVISALLFAIAHYDHGPDPIPLFVLAVGLGYLYQQTQRIIPSLVVHACLNACTLAMMWVAVQAPDSRPPAPDARLPTPGARLQYEKSSNLGS